MGKKLTTKQASAKLLDLNNKAHKALGDFINNMTVKEDIAIVPAAALKDALDAGIVAVNLLSDVKPTALELKNIDALNKAIIKVQELYPESEGKVTMPVNFASNPAKQVGEFDMTSVLDNLANQIHDAAMDIVGTTKEVGGCSVEEILPDDAHAVSQYCSGVVSNISKAVVTKVSPKKVTVGDKPQFIKYPQLIIHKLGLHKVEVSPSSEDGKATVAVDYHDSVGYPDSKTREEGVRQRLVKEGFKCYPQPSNILYCFHDIEKDKLARLATFFSLLLNADVAHMGKDTVPVVSDKVWDIAGKLNQEYPGEVYKAPQGQVDWSTAHKQWQQEKEIYEKKVIYEDLRELAIIRDKHHEIEAMYGIETGAASIKGAKEIAQNAKNALSLIKKNGWESHGLGSNIATLDKKIAGDDLTGLVHLSDGIGHVIHMALNSVLYGEGSYGGCSTKSDIENVNAGNLAYCEGVLKGTTAELSKSGNMVTHKVAPHSYETFILDEDPEGGYHITLFLPTEHIGGEMSKELMDFFKKNKNFQCTASKCTGYIKSLDDIRQLALLMSNLKGASKAIGAECVPKAIDMANDTAMGQNLDKGVFAFTQETVMPNDKAWIEMCHKKFGILPPGLTEEEKAILQILGPEKIHGGCSFADTETLPNEGMLRYCEGVRQNPQDNISGHFTKQGYLSHFFHDTVDQLATVNITAVEKNKYLVELDNIDMRGEALQKEVVKQLKTVGFNCPTNAQCSAEMTPDGIRIIAAFLSSLHQAYKLTPTCTKEAVSYALKQLEALPNDVFLFSNKVYPWYKEDWEKEVCSKIAGGMKPEEVAVEAIKGEIMPPKPAGVAEWTGGPTPQPPFKVGGCTSKTKAVPTGAKQDYCSGVLGKFMYKGKEEMFSIPGLLPDTAAQLGPAENWHGVGGKVRVLFDTKFKKIFITLPEELAKIKPLTDTLTEKFYLKKQDGNTYAGTPWIPRLARFFSHISNIWMLPENCHGAAVLHAFNQAQNQNVGTILPYVASDWLETVCKGVTFEGFKWHGPLEKYKTKDGLTWTIPKGHIVELAATGVGAGPITSLLMSESPWSDIGPLPLGEYGDAKEIAEFYTGEEKAPAKGKISPEGLKKLIYGVVSQKHDSKMPWKSIVDYVQGLYPDTPSGPGDEKGTITWAVDELTKEGKLIFIEGTTWGLAKFYGKEVPALPTYMDILKAPWSFSWGEHKIVEKELDLIEKCFAKKLADATGIKDLSFSVKFTKELATNKGWLDKYNLTVNDLKKMWAECITEVGITPTKIKPTTEQLEAMILNFLKPSSPAEWHHIDEITKWLQEHYDVTEAEIKKALTKLNNEGKIWSSGKNYKIPEEAKPGLDELIETSYQDFLKLTKEVKEDKELFNKCKEATAYKKLPKKCKDMVHTYMNWMLLKGHKSGKGFDDILTETQKIILETYPGLTPLMVKLQLEIEKKAKIRKGELPTEVGEKVAKHYESLTEDEKAAVDEYIEESVGEGQTDALVMLDTMQHFGLESSPELEKVVKNFISFKGPAEEINYLKAPWLFPSHANEFGKQYEAALEISKCFAEKAKEAGSKYDFTGGYYPISLSSATQSLKLSEETIKKLWEECYDEWESGLAIGKLYENLTGAEKDQIDEYIVQQSDYPTDEVVDFVYGTYGIPYSDALKQKIIEVQGGYKPTPPEEEEVTPEQEEAAKQVIVDYFMSNAGEVFSESDIDDFIVNQTDFGELLNVEKLLNELTAEKKIFYNYEAEGWYYTPEGKAEKEEKELKSWLELTPEEKKAFAVNVKESGISGWENLKEMAIEEGIEPDEDVLPSISELHDMAETLKEKPEPLVLEQFILDTLKEDPGQPWSVAALHNALVVEGYDIPDDEIQDALETLVKNENVKWVLHDNTYFWGEPKKVLDKELEAPIVQILLEKAPKKLWATEVAGFLEKMGYETMGILPVGDKLVEMAKSGKIQAALGEEPWLFWIGKQEVSFKAEEEPKKYETLEPEEKAEVDEVIKSLAEGGFNSTTIYYELKKDYNLTESSGLIKAINTATQKLKPLHFSDMNQKKQAEVTSDILTSVQQGQSYEAIKEFIEMKHPQLEWDAELGDIVDGLIMKWHEEMKEAAGPPPFEEEAPAPPPMPEKALDETISSFVQMGWSPEAVTAFLTGEGDPKLILKKAKKLYDIYKPELRPVIYPYAELNPAVKAHLENLAAMMLSEGKSQEDTAWYIAHNYSVDKETVKPVVHEIAKKPLSQVELTVKAMKLMGAGQYIGGCELAQPPSKLVPQTVAYCQGIMDKKGTIDEGDLITHEGDSQVIDIATLILDSTWQTQIKYKTAQKDNWQERLDGLPDILSDLLGEESECVQVGVESSITCTMKGTDGMSVSIADQDKLRRAALFLSQIDNVAKLEKTCIPKALQFAKEKAINVNQTSKPWTVGPYPDKVEDWEQVVCSK